MPSSNVLDDYGGASPRPPSSAGRWCCGISGHGMSMPQQENSKLSCLPSVKSQSLRETLQKNSTEGEKRRLTTTESHKATDSVAGDEADCDEMTKALEAIQAREEGIEKRKLEVRQRVQAKLSKVEVEARNLESLRKELEALEDPTRKEISDIRKKIEAVEKELKPLKQLCEKKEREYHDVLRSHDEKTKLRSDLIGKLMEVVNRSETLRMKKLEDLASNFESLMAKEAGHAAPAPSAPATPLPPPPPPPTPPSTEHSGASFVPAHILSQATQANY